MISKADTLKVLFVCTGNSCRSQMAEGWARHLKSDCIESFSAGVAPYKLSGRAVQVMAEAGVDISDHYAKHADDLAGLDFDYVVTLCDNARQRCPVYSGKTKMIHSNFHDPMFAVGTKEQIMDEFRRIRDQIRDFVAGMPENLRK